MKIPVSLKHKPVMVSEDYDKIDGRLAPNSDTQGLSLGLAQWNERGQVDISAKIWRHTGTKWSRQSEEMPLHRVLDLAILVCRTKQYFAERYHRTNEDYADFPTIDRIGLQGGAMTVEVCQGNEHITEDMKLFDDRLRQDDEIIGERMRTLAGLLKKLDY